MKHIGIGLIMVALAGHAWAMRTTAEPPSSTATAPPPSGKSQSAARDDSAGLRSGAIETVNMGKSTFQVYGQSVGFDARQVKVFGTDGKPSSVYALKKGSRVRFTLDPSDPTHRRAGVIYVQ